MASQKIKKYLVYYQKTLKEDPGNIEARLRLAAIFREMGRISHAVDEYVTAAKLLASQGLPLEALAACKAILELEPTHTETQFFLARLYAQVPEISGDAVRVARPLDDGTAGRASSPSAAAVLDVSTLRVQAMSVRDLADIEDGTGRAITLNQPKTVARHPSVAATSAQAATVVAGLDEFSDMMMPAETERSDLITFTIDEDEDDDGADEVEESTSPRLPALAEGDGVVSRQEMLTMPALPSIRRDSKAVQATSELRATVDIGVEDILDEWQGEAQPEDATVMLSSPVMPADFYDQEHTFELGVFDIDSLGLDESSNEKWKSMSFYDEIDEPDSTELSVADLSSGTHPAILSVTRAKLPEIPLFSQLNANAFMKLLKVIDIRRVPAQAVITNPNDDSASLFVIIKGRVRVEKNLSDGRTVPLALLAEGEFFGEFRLLTGRDGLAQVVAESDVELLEIRDEVLFELAATHPEVWDALWNFYYARMLNNLLASSRMFNRLTLGEREALASRFVLEEVLAGQIILDQGQSSAGVYLIVIGEVLFKQPASQERAEQLDSLCEGDFFGVTPTATNSPSTATVRAQVDTVVLRLPADEFRKALRQHDSVAREVDKVVRELRNMNAQFTRGTTPYGASSMVKPE
ncbi:MAG: cyclic nucleotide-binding domain-containing protein [Bradymonadaceae bacterium]|nr:cyclic nucleotide-binding domain-containing protein [Lujinxingiaceae bacterium]